MGAILDRHAFPLAADLGIHRRPDRLRVIEPRPADVDHFDAELFGGDRADGLRHPLGDRFQLDFARCE